jgi:hypothetical protein
MSGTAASPSPPPGGPAFVPNATTTGGAPSTSGGPFNPNMAQGPTPPGSSASPPNMTPSNSSSSNAGSTGSMFTSLHSLAVPMPTPGTDNAPYFKGTRVEDFLDSLENHADNARLSHTYLPAYVPRYCSDKIRQMIRRHAVWSGTDWAAARAFLVKLYASADQDPLITSDKFRAWVKRHATEGAFTRLQDIDKYYRRFITQSDFLIAQQEILQRDVNLLFFQGIPDPIRKKVKKGLPSTNQKITNPPDVDVTLGVLRREFDETDLDAVVRDIDLHDYSDDEESDNSDLETTTRVKSKPKKKKSVKFESNIVPAAPIVEPIPMADVDTLSRQVQELAMEKQRLLQELANARNPAPPTERKCFICDGTFIHRLGVANCIETRNLINEGLAIYNTVGRLVRPDGTDLPRNGGGIGGVARILREEKARQSVPGPSRKGKERETPPHFAQPAGIQCDGHDLLGRDVYAISSVPQWTSSYPVTRSQKELPQTEPYTLKKPERKPKQAPIIPPPPKHAPTAQAPVPAPPAFPAPVTASRVPRPAKIPKAAPAPQVPPPQPPYQNTADAWKEKKKTSPKKTDYQDVEMQDATKGKGGYHFTSTIQEMADGDVVQSRILDTMITLPLRDIIGMSADLQKRFAGLTKTRREYSQKVVATSYGHGECVDECGSEGESDTELSTDEEYQEMATTESRLQFSYDTNEDVQEILERYTSAVALHTAPLFAMSTGSFEGNMAGRKVTFMVDTGSELNLMSEEFYRQTSLPLDHDGRRWSLKGINGPAVPLVGCVRNSPVDIGGHSFDHHFFVSSEGTGKQEIILGQPWMLWYAADISYSRSEGVHLHLWASGERRCPKHKHRIPPTLSIQLCPVDSPRNADRLVLLPISHRAMIEEVSDEDAEN